MNALAPTIDVAVIGAGTMGSGIAQVAACAGHKVFLFDSGPDAGARGRAGIERDLRFLVGKGKLSEAECALVLDRIQLPERLEDLKTAGLAIEAVVEDLDVKRELFQRLEALLSPDAVLATNTSSISITAIAAGLARPERLLGLHFFNPAPRMALVEVISGLASDPRLADCLVETAKAWGKIPVRVRSTPGFIVNRVARPYYGEALRVLEQGAATPATIDALMRDACGFRMGPFELMDLIGHDVNFAVTKSVFDACFGDRRYAPSLIQQELVRAGRLGRKAGQGFYTYGEPASLPPPAILAPQPVPEAVVVVGELGIAAPLAQRVARAGIRVYDEPAAGAGYLRVGGVHLALSDGRTATARASAEGIGSLVLFDLAHDFVSASRLAVVVADQADPDASLAAVGALQAAGIAVSRLDDVAGLIGLRTVCMLANEAADVVNTGVATAADVDAAMRHGAGYPEGPLAWADRLGCRFVAEVLDNLDRHYGDGRYRPSPLIGRRAAAGSPLANVLG